MAGSGMDPLHARQKTLADTAQPKYLRRMAMTHLGKHASALNANIRHAALPRSTMISSAS
jgi:hypothetical protein